MKRYIKSAINDICSEDFDVREELSESATTSPEILAQLVSDKRAVIRKNVAINPNTPMYAITELARDPNYAVRHALSYRKDLSADVLSTLSNTNELTILDRIVQADNVTEEILLDLLSRDTKDHDNAYVVSRSEKASERVIRYIFDTCAYDTSVLHRLAKNPNTPQDILVEISKNPDDWASVPAKRRLGIPL